jgi:hypothetical protein
MSATRTWIRGARLGAAALLGLGLVLPAVTACSSSTGDETEQVEESDEDSGEQDGDLEETDPEPDIEE